MNWNVHADREEKRRWLLDAVASVEQAVLLDVEESEQLRTTAPRMFDALHASGLFWLKFPELLGGLEADPLLQVEVIEALARLDASAAWTVMIGSQSTGLPAAWLPDNVVGEIFGGPRLPVAAGSLMPSGSAIPVAGGYRVSGRWGFASGIRHCEWVNATVRVEGAGTDPSTLRRVVLPTQDVEIHDNWDAVGLKGTGSCDFTVADRFVPTAFSWGFTDPPRRGGPLYLLGLPGYVAYEHAALALGVARHALDLLVDRSSGKARGFEGSVVGERGAFQRDLGRLDRQLSAARALTFEVFGRVWDEMRRGNAPARPPLPRQQAEMRSTAAHATDVGLEAVTAAFRYSGGEAVHQSDPLQRCWRDLNTAAQHFLVSESSYENHGRFLLGHPEAKPFG